MGVPDRGRIRLDVDARLDHLAPGDGQVVALQAGAPQPRRELDRRARDVAVLLGGAHLGLPEGGVRNDATIPAAAFRQGHPWRLTLACAVPGRPVYGPGRALAGFTGPLHGSYAAVKAMAQLRRS